MKKKVTDADVLRALPVILPRREDGKPRTRKEVDKFVATVRKMLEEREE